MMLVGRFCEIISISIAAKRGATELLPLLTHSALFYVNDWNLRNGPALIWAGNFKLDHRDSIGWTTHDTQATTDTLLRSEEHTSELQSHLNLVCRLLLEKKKKQTHN